MTTDNKRSMMQVVKGAEEMALYTNSGAIATTLDLALQEGDPEVLRIVATSTVAYLQDVATVAKKVLVHYAGFSNRLRKAGGSTFDEDEEACAQFYTEEAAKIEKLLDTLMGKIG